MIVRTVVSRSLPRVREGREIVRAHKVCRRRPHKREIKRVPEVVGVSLGEFTNRAMGFVVDSVPVELRYRVGRRSESQRDLVRRADRDILGQPSADGFLEILARHDAGGLEVGDLACGVNPGIGSPGSQNRHLMVNDPPQSLLDRLLHRPHARLPLPAVEVGTVVGDQQADITQHPGNSRATREEDQCRPATAQRALARTVWPRIAVVSITPQCSRTSDTRQRSRGQ